MKPCQKLKQIMHYAFYGRSCKAKLKTPYTPSTSESENPKIPVRDTSKAIRYGIAEAMPVFRQSSFRKSSMSDGVAIYFADA